MTDVVAVRWPDEREKAARLVTAGVPLLYIVQEEDDPPAPTGCLEDWVRIPGDDRDLQARLAALEFRATLHHGPPFVDDAGRLHHRGSVVSLTPTEARIARVLTARVGAVVSDQELLDVLRDGTQPTTSLRAEVGRLRSRVRQVQLTISRTRRRGYVMLVSY